MVCLQIQHTSAFPVGRGRAARWLRAIHVREVVFDVQVGAVVVRMVEMRKLIVRMVLVVIAARRIVVGENQVGIVVINDNIWFLCGAVFGDYFHVGLVIRPRVCVRLLIGCGEVIVYPVEAAIVAVEDIRQHVLVVCVHIVARLGDYVSKVEVAVGIVAVD